MVAGCLRPVRDAPLDPEYAWRTYQGSPDRNAFADERISEDEPDVEWNENTGRGLSAPPVPLGPVLVATTTNRMVIALSSESGGIYWEHRKNGPFVTPAVSDGLRLYLATSDIRARVYGLRLVDGGEEWEKDYPGLSVPMILSGGRLFLATEPGLVVALRAQDGQELWRASLGAPTAAAPVMTDDRLLVATIRDTLYAVGLEDGDIVARRPVPARVSATPASGLGTVLFPLQSGHVLALDPESLEERWTAFVGAPVLAAPVLARDGQAYVLTTAGVVWAVSPEGDPARLCDLGAAATGALTVTANAIIAGLLDGRVVALSRVDGSVLWSVEIGDSVNTPPVVQGGAIYVPLRRGRVAKLR
jgi:outer membrane protein assembly factor BamB